MNWLYYLLEANLYLAAFYLVYYFVLRRETYYQLNRAYLLTACVVAFIIPLMQVGSLRKYNPPPVTHVAQVISVVDATPVVHQVAVPVSIAPVWTAADYYLLAYTLIAGVMLIAFGVKLFKLIQLSRTARQSATNGLYVVEIAEHNNAFSFFKYLFIDPKLANSPAVVQHELVHIRQKHSLDIVFLELFKVINWFNPVVYLLQNSLKELHEYIADQETARQQQDVNGYTDFLIHNAYGFAPNTLTNNFFNKNLLKQRIIMLHQKRSGGLARLKLLLILPLCAGLLCASTLAFAKSYAYIDLLPHKVVADKLNQQVPPPPPPKPKVDQVRFPPPVVLNNNYIELGIYMQNHLKYPKIATANHTAGTVILNFRLDEKHMITDIKVEKSIGNGLDEEGVRLMHDFKKAVNDKPGYHTIGLNFRIKGQPAPETVSPEAKNKPGYVGELMLPGALRFPPPVIKPDGVPPPPPPKHKVDKVRFPPPVVRADGAVPPPPPKPKVDRVRFPDTVDAADFHDFYKEVASRIRYSADAREKHIQGRVFVVFNIDNDRRIRNIKIVRGLTDVQNMEVINQLSITSVPAAAKTGVNYTMPITFSLAGKDGNSVPLDTHFKGAAYTKDYKPNNYPYKSLHEIVVTAYAD